MRQHASGHQAVGNKTVGMAMSTPLYSESTFTQPSRSLNTFSYANAFRPMLLPPQIALIQPRETPSSRNPFHTQHICQQIQAINRTNGCFPGYFPMQPQDPRTQPTFAHSGATSSSHNTDSSWTGHVQSHPEAVMAQPTRQINNASTSRVFTYEEFINTPATTFSASHPTTVHHGEYASSQHMPRSTDPTQCTQTIDSRTTHASTASSHGSTQVVPASTGPSTASIGAFSYSIQSSATLGKHPTELSRPQNTPLMLPDSLADGHDHLTTGTKRGCNYSVESTVSQPGGVRKRRKKNTSPPIGTNTRPHQKSSGICLAQDINDPRQDPLVAGTNSSSSRSQASDQGFGIQQTSATNASHVEPHAQTAILPTVTQTTKAGTESYDTEQQNSINNVGHDDHTSDTQIRTTTASVNSQVSIETSLQKILDLSGAIKCKTMPRAEALTMMDNIRDNVERSIRDWHHDLTSKENDALLELRVVHELTPATYD